ncbi:MULTISPECIES: hypothetical protein [Moraxella]|uniref:Uncharacterized protein n=1 Tax=Moraxella catarrhalis TaxID=480 RepID=A0A7Z0UXU3_MORCA|nr:hypothetical protein [Moraxella catarrhalis]OAV00238.1 hypothetical protein AO382_1388 [Moraxella catarrhalis]
MKRKCPTIAQNALSTLDTKRIAEDSLRRAHAHQMQSNRQIKSPQAGEAIARHRCRGSAIWRLERAGSILS